MMICLSSGSQCVTYFMNPRKWSPEDGAFSLSSGQVRRVKSNILSDSWFPVCTSGSIFCRLARNDAEIFSASQLRLVSRVCIRGTHHAVSFLMPKIYDVHDMVHAIFWNAYYLAINLSVGDGSLLSCCFQDTWMCVAHHT